MKRFNQNCIICSSQFQFCLLYSTSAAVTGLHVGHCVAESVCDWL